MAYASSSNSPSSTFAVSDPGFAFADYDYSSLTLGEGITLTRLGQAPQALDVFDRQNQAGVTPSERIRIEVINHQTNAAICAGDLDRAVTFLQAGMTGAKALGSQRRYNEAYENFKQMSLLWPHERQVKELNESFAG